MSSFSGHHTTWLTLSSIEFCVDMIESISSEKKFITLLSRSLCMLCLKRRLFLFYFCSLFFCFYHIILLWEKEKKVVVSDYLVLWAPENVPAPVLELDTVTLKEHWLSFLWVLVYMAYGCFLLTSVKLEILVFAYYVRGKDRWNIMCLCTDIFGERWWININLYI